MIGLHIKTIREHLEHCLSVAEAELDKVSSKIDNRAAAEKYTKHSEDRYKLTKDIRFANDLIDFFIDRPQYASYHTVTQLILSCWDFVRSILLVLRHICNDRHTTYRLRPANSRQEKSHILTRSDRIT